MGLFKFLKRGKPDSNVPNLDFETELKFPDFPESKKIELPKFEPNLPKEILIKIEEPPKTPDFLKFKKAKSEKNEIDDIDRLLHFPKHEDFPSFEELKETFSRQLHQQAFEEKKAMINSQANVQLSTSHELQTTPSHDIQPFEEVPSTFKTFGKFQPYPQPTRTIHPYRARKKPKKVFVEITNYEEILSNVFEVHEKLNKLSTSLYIDSVNNKKDEQYQKFKEGLSNINSKFKKIDYILFKINKVN